MKQNEITVTFYKEHTDDPKSWLSPRPAFGLEKFNKELERRGGSIGSVPRFRCRWAGEHDEYLIEEFDVLTDYVYRDEKGIERFISATNYEFEFPDNAAVAPRFEPHKVFTPRFVIEEYREPFYHKGWFIETIQVRSKQYGRVELLSTYRQPSERDIEMCEHLARLRDTLTPEQIADGVAKLKALSDAEDKRVKDELKDDIKEDFKKALIDGLPNAKKFGFNPNLQFDINAYSKNLIKEHNEKI